MLKPFLLAHLSDIHLSPLPPFALRHWNVKRALGYLNWHRKRRHVHRREVVDLITQDLARQRPDHIAVTGDLVNIALPGEYIAARAWLEGVGRPDHVSLVPGNHDIYTRLRREPGVGRWADYMQGDDACAAGAAPPGLEFPYVRRRGPIAIVGLNSAVPTPPGVAAGALGDKQLAALPALLDRLAAEGLCRVVLIHHPPLPGQAGRARGLRDAPDLERVLTAHGAELVLHGHNHRDMLAWRQWPGGRFPVIGIATGSAAKVHHEEPLARYNLIEIEGKPGHVKLRVRSRGLAAPDGGVVELGHIVLDRVAAVEVTQ
jgi:3',5'-cyclic AMP phosphodiesterase CpdA